MDFGMDIQEVVDMVDPSLCHYLRTEPNLYNLESWIANINFAKTELILVPYNEKYDIC